MGFASLVKAATKFLKGPSGKGFLAGVGTFVGFEWLTSGGIVNTTAGTLGVSNGTASLMIILALCVAGYFAFSYLNRKFGYRRYNEMDYPVYDRGYRR